MGNWRYQPVYEFHKDENGKETRSYSMIEAYFDDKERFDDWTDPHCTPSGESQGELARDLSMMLADALRYEAVDFADLKEGMVFKDKED